MFYHVLCVPNGSPSFVLPGALTLEVLPGLKSRTPVKRTGVVFGIPPLSGFWSRGATRLGEIGEAALKEKPR